MLQVLYQNTNQAPKHDVLNLKTVKDATLEDHHIDRTYKYTLIRNKLNVLLILNIPESRKSVVKCETQHPNSSHRVL